MCICVVCTMAYLKKKKSELPEITFFRRSKKFFSSRMSFKAADRFDLLVARFKATGLDFAKLYSIPSKLPAKIHRAMCVHLSPQPITFDKHAETKKGKNIRNEDVLHVYKR